jgi:hypothetical protein
MQTACDKASPHAVRARRTGCKPHALVSRRRHLHCMKAARDNIGRANATPGATPGSETRPPPLLVLVSIRVNEPPGQHSKWTPSTNNHTCCSSRVIVTRKNSASNTIRRRHCRQSLQKRRRGNEPSTPTRQPLPPHRRRSRRHAAATSRRHREGRRQSGLRGGQQGPSKARPHKSPRGQFNLHEGTDRGAHRHTIVARETPSQLQVLSAGQVNTSKGQHQRQRTNMEIDDVSRCGCQSRRRNRCRSRRRWGCRSRCRSRCRRRCRRRRRSRCMGAGDGAGVGAGVGAGMGAGVGLRDTGQHGDMARSVQPPRGEQPVAIGRRNHCQSPPTKAFIVVVVVVVVVVASRRHQKSDATTILQPSPPPSRHWVHTACAGASQPAD